MPVDKYPQGASPYGVLDMVGNVWEWTRSQWQNYPYDPTDGRENVSGFDHILVRGGAFSYFEGFARCACRFLTPVNGGRYFGIRVGVGGGSPINSGR